MAAGDAFEYRNPLPGFARFICSARSLYILIAFLCSAFILTFYDGYRSIYLDATFLSGRHPDRPMTENVEEARRLSYDHFMEEIEFFQDRSSMGTPGQALDKRHKLRWLYKSAEAAVYQWFASNMSIAASLYVKYAHYSAWMVVTLIFTAASAWRLRRGLSTEGLAVISIALFAYISLVSSVPRMVDQHSLIEMGMMAAAVHFSLARRLSWMVLAVVIAVANRETGAALGMIYAIVNWRERWFWLPAVAGPALLALINIDLLLLPDFYDPSNFVVHGGAGYINLFNLAAVPASLIAFTALKTFAVLAPGIAILHMVWHSTLGRRLALVGLFYLMVLMLGTILGNLFAYAMLLPVMATMGALAYPKTAQAA